MYTIVHICMNNIQYCILCIVRKCVQLCVVHLDKIVETAQIFFSDFKTNFNGAIFEESNEAGIGVVVQNPNGEVMATLAEKIPKLLFVTVLVLLAA